MKYALLLVSIIFIGCNADKDDVASLSGLGDQVNLEDPEAILDDAPAEESNPLLKAKYSFNLLSGKCLNNNQEEGLNEDGFGECADLSNQNLEELDFKKSKNYWKANIHNSLIANSKLNFGKIAKYEVDYNENTIFDGSKHSFTKLFDQHVKQIHGQKNLMDKKNNKVSKIQSQIEALMSKYEDEENPKKIKQYQKKLAKLQKSLDKEKLKVQHAMNKMYRHQSLSKKTYEFAMNEPKMVNPKIKNKKWHTLTDMADSASFESFANLVDEREFSLSLWFRATESSKGEGRVVNFLHSGNQSSLIFGVQKDKVFFGYRDQDKKYKRSDYSYDYSDGQWHNLVVTYSADTFQVYLDGEVLNTINDSFLGFGQEKATLGSYKLKSHLFTGDIDEMSAWSVALEKEDVQKIYNDGTPTQLKRHLKHDSLVRWWRMGDKVARSVAGQLD
jgi:hypothetical protein